MGRAHWPCGDLGRRRGGSCSAAPRSVSWRARPASGSQAAALAGTGASDSPGRRRQDRPVVAEAAPWRRAAPGTAGAVGRAASPCCRRSAWRGGLLGPDLRLRAPGSPLMHSRARASTSAPGCRSSASRARSGLNPQRSELFRLSPCLAVRARWPSPSRRT